MTIKVASLLIIQSATRVKQEKGFNIRVMCTNLDTWIYLLLTAPLSFDLVIAKVCFSTELSFYF